MDLKMLTFVGCIFLVVFHSALSQPFEFENLSGSEITLKDGHLKHRKLHHFSRHSSFHQNHEEKKKDDLSYVPFGFTEFYGCDNVVTAYKFSETKKTWMDAKKSCYYEGGYLGFPDCPAEGKAFHNILRYKNNGGAWIGMNDIAEEGNWITVFNDKVNEISYVNWAPTEPNNYGIYGEDCAEMYDTDGKWYDSACDKKLFYVCKVDVYINFNATRSNN